jgi:ubiquinol-cytochrome c reductase cytochrome c1 subunit
MIWRLVILLSICFSVGASNDAKPPKIMSWPFAGIFGTFDRQAAQRGFQVFKEVCSACHSLTHVSYRHLKGIGFSDAEIKEIAKGYTVKDGPNDQGEMFDRPALPSDLFFNPSPNEQAARAYNNGAYPPDLSLIVKARHNGPNYIYSILTGFIDAPSDFKLTDGLHYNPYFPGRQIAMPAPLSDDLVKYMDGTHSSVEQMAEDVVVFLQWAAEPEMENRKSMGLKIMFFLVIFTIVSYVAKKRIWSKLN